MRLVFATPHPPQAVPLPPLGKVGFSGNRSKSYRGNTHKQFCPYFTLYRKKSIIFYLPQRGKCGGRNVPCLRVSAKQIYDRLRSSRMTDEVLLTVFADERLRHRFVGEGSPLPKKRTVFTKYNLCPRDTSIHKCSAGGTRSPFPRWGRLGLGVSLNC